MLFEKIENTNLKKLHKKSKKLPEERYIECDEAQPSNVPKQQIYIACEVLEHLDRMLRPIIYKIDMLVDINKDYRSYRKYQKRLVKDGYKIARSIQKLHANFAKDKTVKRLKSSKHLIEAFDLLIKKYERYVYTPSYEHF